MKLWRKQAKKTKDQNGREIDRNGRSIKNSNQWAEQIGRVSKRSYELLDNLFEHAKITFVLSKKEQDRLKEMIAKANEETANETV